MNAKQTIDRVKEDVYEVISHFVDLKPKGNKFQGSCPLHGEKTASFFVTPHMGIFKCFGCGKSGSSIDFIMEHEGVEFKEAVEIAAKKLSIDFTWDTNTDFNSTEYKHQESLKILCKLASEFFTEQLNNNKDVQKIIYDRDILFGKENIFKLGFAPAGNAFLKHMQKNRMNLDLALEAGLLKNMGNGFFDAFQNRIMFPFVDKNGQVIGFTGRTILEDKKVAKYSNTAETPIFVKGDFLYGLNTARGHIKKVDRAYFVEGNTDVIRLNKIGVPNTIASSGTALTPNQISLLRNYTNKVTLIYDGDKAGANAMTKNAELLIKNQFYVSVIILPEDEDPDSYFTDFEIFEKANNEAQDYIIHKVTVNKEKCKNPVFKSDLIKDTAALISNYDEPSKQEVYLEAASAILKPRKLWQDTINTFVEEKAPVEKKSFIPNNVNLSDYQETGFYAYQNCYFFQDKKGRPEQQSNFTMTPLFHIESTINAKRLYEVVNKDNIKKVIEIPQRDLISIAAFKLRIESLGNFLWTGSESDLNKLKSWLYGNTSTCKEIEYVGWQKEGFFVWGNGIFNGKFTETDSYGIVVHNDKNYYIPAKSVIYKEEESLYEFERKFIHIEGNKTLKEYFSKFVQVYGENGKISLCFLFASLFRDVVVNRFEKFPLLNLFGPKGAGKNACAESLLHFFGQRPRVPNLHNTSKPALADHVATSTNAVCVVDEYRNDLEMEKREFLKGLWDGTGRTRMNMDKDKKKETTRVEQGVIVCGQQMATADIALFSRFVVLSFNQTTYSKEEEDNFKELEQWNKYGLTHITHQILKTRSYFQSNYSHVVEKTADKFRSLLGNISVETRIFNNWMSIVAAYATIHDELEIPWKLEEVIEIAVKLMKIQNSEIKRNDDLGSFWKIVQYLLSSDFLFEGGDYKVVNTSYICWKQDNNPKHNKILEWTEEKNLIYITTARVFSLYKNQVLKEGDKPLPASTIEHYLRHTPAFICETKKEGFKKINPKTGLQETRNDKKLRTSTTAFVFDLAKLDLTLPTDTPEEEENEPLNPNQNTDSPNTEVKQSSNNTETPAADLPF